MDKPSITKASENGFFAIAPGVATITKELVSYAHSLGLSILLTRYANRISEN